ncbi:MAG: DNA mismatch repair protein MutS [archaeon]|nr:DNA mismatch repair protein MutS [archaeon]
MTGVGTPGQQRLATGRGATPAMAQYFELKEAHPGYLMLFRMGDFYEMFFDDAVAASALLGIALTSRKVSKAKGGAPIPMAGIPHFAADSYIEKLVRAGVRVAVCEQVEDVASAKKRRSSVVRREVTRLITPGTLIEERFLKPQRHNYLCAISAGDQQRFDVAWLDLSTGDFEFASFDGHHLPSELLRLAPQEILVQPSFLHAHPPVETFIRRSGWSVTLCDHDQQQQQQQQQQLQSQTCHHHEQKKDENEQEENKTESTLSASASSFGYDQSLACRLLRLYVQETQKGKMPSELQQPAPYQTDNAMYIDPPAWVSLELTQKIRSFPSQAAKDDAPTGTGEKDGSLLHLLDQTSTAAGSRLLASRLGAPLLSIQQINERLDLVQFFLDRAHLTREIRSGMASIYDSVRCLQRLALGRGSPRDMLSVLLTLVRSNDMRLRVLQESSLSSGLSSGLPAAFATELEQAKDLSGFANKISAALSEEAISSASLQGGGFIAAGYHAELDNFRKLARNGEDAVQELQQRFREETRIKSLKIKFNNIIGYFVEVPSSLLSAAGASREATQERRKEEGQTVHIPADYTLLQHLSSGYVRYKPRALADLELAIQRAENEAVALECRIFDELRMQVLAESPSIRHLSHVIAQIDVAIGLAQLSRQHLYVRPHVIEHEQPVFSVRGGRHPIIEAAQTTDTATPSTFVANDCELSHDSATTALLTGPNMGGKSTFLRQNALIAIMAQIGSFVPAESARLSPIDALFSRVGSSDDLSNNMSTFMVEMIETSAILTRAGARSLIIMDEVGRGTSTHDGLSIACAVLEHLHTVSRARILFATHYRELAEMEQRVPGLKCLTMEVIELSQPTATTNIAISDVGITSNPILFTHRVVPGVADRSYGIHCAQLAGLPPSVLLRAQQILNKISSSEPMSSTLY